jgi:hypothetical protein
VYICDTGRPVAQALIALRAFDGRMRVRSLGCWHRHCLLARSCAEASYLINWGMPLRTVGQSFDYLGYLAEWIGMHESVSSSRLFARAIVSGAVASTCCELAHV